MRVAVERRGERGRRCGDQGGIQLLTLERAYAMLGFFNQRVKSGTPRVGIPTRVELCHWLDARGKAARRRMGIG